MGKLVSVEQVRTRIMFDAVADIDATIGSILDNLTPEIEIELRTKVAYGTYTDTFFVQNSLQFGPGERGRTFLSLSRGFVVGDLTSMVYATSRRGLASDATNGLDYTDLHGDAERGLLIVSDLSLSDAYVQVTYTAGLELGTDDVYVDVPLWLQELAILWAVMKLDTIHPTVRFENGDAISLTALKSLIGQIIVQHVRYDPIAIRPYGS